MATTIKDGSNAKEKSRPSSSSSSNQNIDSPRARRTAPKPLTADSSAEKKPTPNYLKHTKSSGKDVCIYGKNQASDDTNLKYSTSSRRKSTDPSPTQTSSKLKRTMSANPRVKPSTSTRPSSASATPSTKPVGGSTSNKPVLDKTTKTTPLRGGKTQPILTRPMSIKKGTSSSTTRKEYRPKTSLTSLTNKAPQPSKPNHEQETEIKHDEETNMDLEQDIVSELSEKEGIDQEENPPAIDKVEPESKEIEDDKSNDHSDSLPTTSSAEQQEVEPNPTKEEQEVDLEQGNVIEESSNADDKAIPVVDESNEQSKPQEENETNEKLVIEAAKEAKTDEDASKLSFKKGKELEKEEEGNGNQRLKFKERAAGAEGDVDVGEAKTEQENVVLKRQDVQGKKEAQAYNDVIEETASKLVEKRKSKVKALVGAFETVISLEND